MRGAGSLVVARAFTGISTLVLFALLAQTLPSARFGLFGLAWSVSYLFAAVVEGGYGLLVVREVARTPGRAGYYLGAFLSIRMALAVAVLVVALGLAAVFGWDSLPAVIAMAATAANLQVVSGVPREFLMGTDRFGLAGAHAIAETLLRMLIILPTAAITGSITATFAAAALFHLLWVAVGLPLLWRLMRPEGIRDGMRAWRLVLRDSLPFGAFIVLGAAYAQLDVIVASALLPLDTLAIYLVASRILAATDYLPEGIWRWAYPRLSRSDEVLPVRTTRLAWALLVLGVAVGALVVVGSPIAIPVVFGRGYEAAATPVQLMAAAIPLRYLAHAYGTALSAGGQQALRSRLYAGVIVAAVVVEISLTTVAGVVGAALAVGVSAALLAGGCLAAGRRSWGPALDARPALAGGLVAVAVVGLSTVWSR